jgi:signal transduction histidine kinase
MLAHTTLGLPGLFIFFTSCINLCVGLFVLVKNPRSIVNRSFFVFVLGASAWGLGIALLYLSYAFLFDKLALGGGLLMFFGITLFARAFPSCSVIPKKFYLLFIPLAVAAVCLPFNLFIKSIIVDKANLIQPVNGPLFPFYVAIALTYLAFSFYFFRKNFMLAVGESRQQMLYFITGICIFMLSILTFNILLPLFKIYELNLVGPMTSIVFVFMTGYAIVRHQLLDIRVVIQRGLIYSILLSILTSSYMALLFLTESLFDSQEEILHPFFAGIVMLIGIVTIPRIEGYFQRVTNQFFFKAHYDYATALEKLSSILNEHTNFTDMATQILEEINLIMHPVWFQFSHVGTASTFGLFSKNIDFFKEELRILVVARGRTIGTFVFGPKLSNDSYAQEDLRLLRTFAEQAAVAFEKAELIQKLQNYSKSLEIAVLARTTKLEQMQENQRQLFDDISHALQTPLTVLKGIIDLFKIKIHPDQMRTLQPMERSVDDLSRLIREILQLARIDSAPVQSEMEEINLSVLTKEVVEYVEIICTQNGISVRTEIEDGQIISGDQKQLQEALANLLSNAVTYTATCAVKRITITLKSKGNSVELGIHDTGVGIPEEQLPYIFDRFYRAHERDKKVKSGYGLGLAIVKRIIERHRGTIHAESSDTNGTSMIILLPSFGM